MRAPPSSRQRYRRFVDDYLHRRLDDKLEAERNAGRVVEPPAPDEPENGKRPSLFRRIWPKGKRREYLRDYLRWLKPLRAALVFVFVLALIRAGLEMIEP
ncbi:MAG TPA: hypothetical protein VFI52_07915, partial [Gemmatimonadaceae bacterium]|nr:hypothetical protein [Gemmatimonadaceae bacterium]